LFYEKLVAEIKKKNFAPEIGRVNYFEPDDSLRRINPFQKRNTYEYQKEARIIFRNPNIEKEIFHIGTLKDVAIEIFPDIKMYKLVNSENVELIIKVDL